MYNIAKTKRYEKCSCEKESKFYYLDKKNPWQLFLFGQKIENSLSPKIHMGFAKSLNLKIAYESNVLESCVEFEAKKNLLLKSKNFLGANVTHPFKENIPLESSFHISPLVKFLGAYNTIYRRDSTQWGLENTDIYGILKTLQELKLSPIMTFQCFLLGSGGAAKSFVYVILKYFPKSKITIITRNILQAEKKFSMFKNHLDISFRTPNEELQVSSSFPNILVNATPIGLESHHEKAEEILNQFSMARGDCLFDMIYFETFSTQLARKLKIKYLNGYTMLLEQARYSFYLWTNIFPK